jgi:hypothetical protein
MSYLQQAMKGVIVDALGLTTFTDGKGKGKGKKAQADKGGGSKAKGKGKDLPAPGSKHSRTCKWEDCRAARGKGATWGNVPNCFACGRCLSTQPPVEKLTEWAFDELVADRKHQTDKPAPQPKAKAKAKAAAAPAQTEEELKDLRSQRLQQLKEAAWQEGPKPLTATQEMAKVFEE